MSEVNIFANEEVDYAISMVPEFGKLFRNETIDQSHMGVQTESDFYLGCLNCFIILRLNYLIQQLFKS
jgi:hypothetical protein